MYLTLRGNIIVIITLESLSVVLRWFIYIYIIYIISFPNDFNEVHYSIANMFFFVIYHPFILINLENQ